MQNKKKHLQFLAGRIISNGKTKIKSVRCAGSYLLKNISSVCAFLIGTCQNKHIYMSIKLRYCTKIERYKSVTLLQS